MCDIGKVIKMVHMCNECIKHEITCTGSDKQQEQCLKEKSDEKSDTMFNKVRAHTNGYMAETGEQFCTKGKEYDVTKRNDEEAYFEIDDDCGEEHIFDYDDYTRWFEPVNEVEA